jgi:hypothetical protein
MSKKICWQKRCEKTAGEFTGGLCPDCHKKSERIDLIKTVIKNTFLTILWLIAALIFIVAPAYEFFVPNKGPSDQELSDRCWENAKTIEEEQRCYENDLTRDVYDYYEPTR